MAVIRRADASTIARDAIVLDLAEIGLQAERMLERARAEAERIMGEARAERGRLTESASKEGFAKGHAEGHAKGLAEGSAKGLADARAAAASRIESTMKAWSEGLDAFESAREAMLVQSKTDVLALALTAARKVVKRAVACDTQIVLAQMEAAVSRVVGASKMTIAVHPDDLATAAEDAPALLERIGSGAHASVVADENLPRGSCVVRTARGRVDADIDMQLDRIIEALLPGGLPPIGAAPAEPDESPDGAPAGDGAS